ncbi:MAG: hypothetical protein GX752_01850 [Clostridium sp.]|nr:hypothetical protein [Clostridium sp.]
MKNDDYKNDDLNESEDKYLEKQDENINDNIEEKDIIDVDEVYEYDEYQKKDEKKEKRFFKTKVTLVVILIAAVLSILSPIIQEMIFRSDDARMFIPQSGIFGTRLGTVLIFLGIYIIVYSFNYLFKKNTKFNTKQKWVMIALGLLISIVGISTFFRYTEYKENTIVQRNIFQENSYSYLDITEVNVATRSLTGKNSTIKYEYVLKNEKVFVIKVTESNMKEVRNIDGKIKSTARRSIDNYSIQEMERLGMYSKDEALKLFIIE